MFRFDKPNVSEQAGRKSRWRRKSGWSCLVCILGLIGLGLVALPARNPTLLDHAEALSTTAFWLPGYTRNGPGTQYAWLSGDSLLYYPQDNSPNHCHAVLLDTATKIKQLAPAFDYSAAQVLLGVSPDGKRLLWRENHSNSTIDYTVTDVDDSHAVKWTDSQAAFSLAWLPDSQHWAAIETWSSPPKITTHDVASSKTNTISILSPPLSPSDAGGWFAGLNTPQGYAPFSEPIRPNQFHAPDFQNPHLFFLSLFPGARPIQPVALHLPPLHEGDQIKMLLSPQGDRIAWFITSYYQSPIVAWLMTYFRHIHTSSNMVQSLWVSSIDGSNLHPLGNLEPGSHNMMETPLWTPDGKYLSFVYNLTLWRVPAK